MNQGNGNCWLVMLNSSIFTSVGLPWLYHARRFPGVRLYVADAGLEHSQRKQLLDEKVGIPDMPPASRSHFDLWGGILDAGVSDGVILCSAANDLFDPISLFDAGADRMVFGKWPTEFEYYSLCKPLISIASQAKTANFIEDKVAKPMGGLASPLRICGPSYLWKTMVGMARFVRGSQPGYNQEHWEPLAANLFAATYPEYTQLK